MSGVALRLDLSIPPEWSRIDPTRDAVGLLVQAMFGDDDLRDALAMVSEELLENAVKYSKPRTTVTLSIQNEDGRRVVISVTNSVDEGTTHLGTLRERIAWVDGFPSAAEAYTAAIAGVYDGKGDARGPGLGIVRIAYEGRCRLEVDLSGPGRVTVRAACERSLP